MTIVSRSAEKDDYPFVMFVSSLEVMPVDINDIVLLKLVQFIFSNMFTTVTV